MPTLTWCDDFVLDVAEMDQTHREFVDLLAAVEAAPEAELLARWQALTEHTQAHFDAEDRAMQASGFFATNCHTTHHAQVMEALRAGIELARRGDLAPIRQMTRELTVWFPHHASTMDTALAGHLQRVGYQFADGSVSRPEALPSEAITGCGGACSTPEEESATVSA